MVIRQSLLLILQYRLIIRHSLLLILQYRLIIRHTLLLIRQYRMIIRQALSLIRQNLMIIGQALLLIRYDRTINQVSNQLIKNYLSFTIDLNWFNYLYLVIDNFKTISTNEQVSNCKTLFFKVNRKRIKNQSEK